MKRYKNWSSSLKFNPQSIETPKDEAALQKLVRDCASKQTPIRVVGSGHSFTRLIETPGILISLDNLQGLIGLDSESGFAHLWGGTKLWNLNELLFEKKRSLENLGDIDRQSIAGTISTGTHGTGVTLGSVSTQLREITLVTASGDLLTCSPSDHPDVFKAAQVSLGSLGIITRLKMMTLPAYKLEFIQKHELRDEFLKKLPELIQQNRHLEFYSFPYSKYVQTKYTNFTDKPDEKRGFKDYFNDMLMENILFKILSEISKWIPGTTKAVSQLCGAAVSGAHKIHWAHQIYPMPRLVKFQEMEFSIPRDSMRDAVLEIAEMIEKKKMRVHFPIECRYVKADDLWLSPAYGRDSAYIAVHAYQGMEYREYFEAVQSIFKNHQGRPHWGKMHFLTAKELRPLYPMWDRFQEVRNQLDPKGLFMNDALKKLFHV